MIQWDKMSSFKHRQMKSPLKSNIQYKSISQLKKLIPPKSAISSFFLYSGALELALATENRTIIAHTNKYPVYEFWISLMEDPEKIHSYAQQLFPNISVPELYLLQEHWTKQKGRSARSAFFFILNRCSDNGIVSCGKIDKTKFNPLVFSHLRNFKADNFYPFLDKHEDPTEALATAKRTDYILMPAGEYNFNLFEHGKSRGPDTALVDHRKLHETLKTIDKKWLLLYKSHPILFKMYDDYNIVMVDKYGRKVNNKNNCAELIVANF